MKYIEVCNSLKDRGNIKHISELEQKVRDHEFYISMFPFDNSILNYLETNGSISGHKGKHFCDYILIDIDCESDIDQSKVDAIQVVKRLNELYEINPEELFIWFSGNKGFHIALISKMFGNLPPSSDISVIVKNFVKNALAGIDDNIDYAIYENHRIIRVENSLNAKSQLYKIQLSYKELVELSMLEIRRLAKEPRNFQRSILKSQIIYREKINRDLKSPKVEKKSDVIQEGFFTPPTSGNRNNQLFKQACILFKTSDLNEKSVFEIINSINHAGDEPITDSEVQALITSASRNKRQNEEPEIELYTISELIPQYIDSLSEESNRISLVFDSLNNEFKGKLRGTFCVVIGYGGSKKSLYAQNLAFDNVLRHRNKVIYSNMEMSNAILTKRFIDITINGATNSLPSIELENMIANKKDIQDVLLKNVGSFYSDYMKICSTSSMTSDRFDEVIMSLNETIDILIIDGFSMMGGKGNELELANKHSKELKELAKKHNIFVLAIVHASKGDDLETRDLTRKARASEKIMDNCDFAITMSAFKENGEFNEKTGVFNCWNKRGSGKRIERVYELQENSLKVVESSTKHSKEYDNF